MIRRQLLGFSAALFVSAAWGAPIPSALTGDIEEGSTITIDGENFGEGPEVVVFDNFEAGTAGDEVDPANATVGRWLGTPTAGDSAPPYISEGARSGDMAVLAGDSDISAGRALILVAGQEAGPGDEEGFDYFDSDGNLRAFQEVFFRYSVKDLENFPGEGGGPDNFSPDDSSMKGSWMMLGFAGDTRDKGDGRGHDIIVPAWAPSFAITGNNYRPGWHPNGLQDIWDFGGWTTMSFYAKLNESAPYGDVEAAFFDYFSDKGYGRSDFSDNLIHDDPDEDVAPYWDRINFPGWHRNTDDNFKRIMDDIYVAIGPNAQARVELGNASTYEKSTKFALLTPTEWADGSIKATVRSGGFEASEMNTLYLYVTDADGEVNANGLAACPTCPQPAEILE